MNKFLSLFLFLQATLWASIFEDINSKKNVFESGLVLVGLDNGLHFLEEQQPNQTELIIGIHGGGTLGYEWIYPLNTLNNEKNRVAFFRWNPISVSCATEELELLNTLIKEDLKDYEKITFIGHSLGGILLARLVADIEHNKPIEAHIVASPLKGIEPTNNFCNYKPPKKVSNNVDLYEWRTQKNLDGVFMALPYDPQEIEIENSAVTRLPAEYKGNKLGHNWSISWVADQISGN